MGHKQFCRGTYCRCPHTTIAKGLEGIWSGRNYHHRKRCRLPPGDRVESIPLQSYFTTEKIRIALIGLFGLVIGWVAGSIWMGLAITFFLYSCWLIYQARRVDLWLQKGAQRQTAPDTDGVVGNIEKLIFRRRQSDKHRKARMKKILGWYNRSASALPDATVVTNHNFEIIWANDLSLIHI